MTKYDSLQLFEKKKVRTIWDDEQEKWYFAIVDVVAVLTDSVDPQSYWRKLKQRLKEEGNETVTNCHAFKLKAADGKMRITDVADTEQLFRLVQSIPSPKAEPFKVWMSQVASSRLDQMQDPELSIEQAISDYKRLGYFRFMDQPTTEKHRNSQGTDRRMESYRCDGRLSVRYTYRHHHQRMERIQDERIQTVQRLEKRKSP